MSKRDIARQVHASLFSTNLELQQQAITEHYAVDATFDDPLVSVKGIDDIQAQFRFLTYFSYVHSEISSVLLSTTTSEQLTEIRDLVIIDATVRFGVLFISLPVRSITRFEFNQSGKIIKHEDVWSLKHVLGSFPIAGWIYESIRALNGTASSIVLRRLGMIRDSMIGKVK
jgi:hypothetical protein